MVLLRVVPYDGCCVGEGSKQDTIAYDPYQSGALNVVRVESNVPNNFAGSAVIENLIIDGLDQPNTNGILLEDVCNCLVRNVTIKNCDVGIRVRASEGSWAYGNRFEHIRMINVKTGIVFEGASSGSKYFSYTTVDDVRISLAHPNSVGIMVGDGNSFADLHGAFIKATVWMNKTSHRGLVVNGSLRYSLVNLEVEHMDDSVLPGLGVVVNLGATVKDNQNFLLTALWFLSETRQLSVSSGADCNEEDITVFSRDKY